MNADSPREPDEYQRAWQAQSSRTRVTVNADLLSKMQSSQQFLLASISWGNTAIIGTLLLLMPVWIYMGVTIQSPWTWYLEVPADIWVIGFILFYRMRHKPTPSEPGEPLLACARESLAVVEKEIWYYRNILWWYILPMAVPMFAFVIQLTVQKFLPSAHGWQDVLGIVVMNSFLCAVFFGVFYSTYYLNQRVVRTQYEPRRQELLALLDGLSDESGGELAVATNFEGFTPTCKPFGKPARWAMVVYFGIIAAVLSAVLIIFNSLRHSANHFRGVPTVSSYVGPARSSGPEGGSLARLVTALRKEKQLVGLAAMVMVDGRVEAAAAQGERKVGSGKSLELGDQWHLGGVTKCITATMIARLVEAGRMRWLDTVGGAFSEASIHKDWKAVTLRQLLTDTAGAPANFPDAVRRKRPALGAERTQARRAAVLDMIARQPAYPPGTMNVYSNVGYTIAGAMAERVTGIAWEDLVKREVFEPLQLTESGFGPPKSGDDTLEQPRGHLSVAGGKAAVADDVDNTPIMGPSGSVHMTLRDLCTYASEHLAGQRGGGALLTGGSYHVLQTPELGNYACGWLRNGPTADVPYTVYWHNGSNTMWYAFVAFVPEKNMVVAVTANDGDLPSAEAAAWEMVRVCVKRPAMNAEAETPEKAEP